jgi:hypothetical protein
MRPIHAGPGTTDEVATAETRAELIAWYNEQRVAPYYPAGSKRHLLHHKADGPISQYMPINPESVDSDGAGIYEDTTRRALGKSEFKVLKDKLAVEPHTHPVIVHQLVATIEHGFVDD